jgi:hypothetical protein
LPLPEDETISLYHAHGECEQYHSELKTDMGVKRLPSGKFDPSLTEQTIYNREKDG